MNSDDYYSSDSYSESYSDIPNSSKKINVSPPKASQTIRRPLPNARRPIPVRSPIQNINKTPNKSNFQSNITNSSSTKKKYKSLLDLTLIQDHIMNLNIVINIKYHQILFPHRFSK